MRQIVIEEAQKFVSYLRDCDSSGWDILMNQLLSIYKHRNGALFFGLGFEPCNYFAEKHFGQYWYSHCAQDTKYYFRLAQQSVILFAAAEILAEANEKFKLS